MSPTATKVTFCAVAANEDASSIDTNRGRQRMCLSIREGGSGLGEHPLDKGEALHGHVLVAVEQIPPDAGGCCQLRQGAPERLDGEPAVVARIANRAKSVSPVNVAR